MLIEARLQKFLHFPAAESKTYSESDFTLSLGSTVNPLFLGEVLCNFLLGLHAYRGSPEYVASDSLEKEFNGVIKEVRYSSYNFADLCVKRGPSGFRIRSSIVRFRSANGEEGVATAGARQTFSAW